jgi:hypothetical protein
LKNPQPLTYSTESRPAIARVVWRYWRRCAALLCVAAVAAAYIAGFTAGRGGRGFFSPDSLQYRTQSEALLPPTRVPLFRSPYSYHQPPLVQYLVAEGLWAPREAPRPRWVPSFRWNRQWSGGTNELHKELSWRGQTWVDWSKQHPDVAAEMWPLLLKSLRADEPWWVSENRAWWLMHWARKSRDAAEFRSHLASAEGQSMLARTGN